MAAAAGPSRSRTAFLARSPPVSGHPGCGLPSPPQSVGRRPSAGVYPRLPPPAGLRYRLTGPPRRCVGPGTRGCPWGGGLVPGLGKESFPLWGRALPVRGGERGLCLPTRSRQQIAERRSAAISQSCGKRNVSSGHGFSRQQ